MNRRHILAFAGSGMLLAGCSTLTATTTLNTTVISDVTTIANGLAGILPVIDTITGLSGTALSDIASAITDLQSLAAQFTTVTSISGAQPLVQQVETDINTVVAALAMVPVLPPMVEVALQAVNLLLPIIEAAVNLVVSRQLTQRSPAHMTPDQARRVLQALAR
jgi:hypothetical protein